MTNQITDFYHASAVEKENKEFKNLENKKSQKNKESQNSMSINIKESKVANKTSENSFQTVENKQTKRINSKTALAVKNIIQDNAKKIKKQNIKKIANIIQESKKIFSGYDITDYECIDILTGDATFYTATGNPMSNGKFPIAGQDCAMPSKFLNSIAEIKFANGKTIWRKVSDTGSALNSGKAIIDIYCDTKEECMQNGRKKGTTVKVWQKKSKNQNNKKYKN